MIVYWPRWELEDRGIPRGYGIAWWTRNDYAPLMPKPIHWLARLLRPRDTEAP